MQSLKKLLFILIVTLYTSQIASAQSTVSMDTSLFKLFVVKAKQAYIDSIALEECEQKSILFDAKFEAMKMQSENFKMQLIANTDKLNQVNKDYYKLTKSVKTKNVLIVGLVILSTVLIIK